MAAIPGWWAPWRQNLLPASYMGAVFHVDVNARASGRRIASHEFPHIDKPFSEDLGRRIKRFTVTGYVISGPFVRNNANLDYKVLRDALIAALETNGPGILVLPTALTSQGDLDNRRVMADAYSVTEHREKGGWAEFEMTFVEYGGPLTIPVATQQQVTTLTQAMGQATATSLNTALINWYLAGAQ
jgi:DNA circularisation protein N-terminus